MMSMDYSKKQKQKYKELNRRLMQYVAMVNQIYQSYNEEASRIAMTTGYNSDSEGDFKFSDYPKTKYSIEKLQRNFADNMQALIYSGISKEWKNSNDAQDLLANEILKKYKGQVNGEKQKIIYQTNSDAMKAFANRTDKGLDLSDKVWKQSDEYVRALEAAISTAISKGTSAVTLSKQISKYLIDFDKLQKDYKSQFGQATDIHDCEYRSARLARSEINMAYRTAEQTRWNEMDFVRGYRIELSNNHSDRRKKHGEYSDICDELQGDYPKDFKWTGWHPNCYQKGTMVLTADGWKDFADVEKDDLILSLNPATKRTEWVGITDKQIFRHTGKMVRFFNHSLECVVTPEHSMVYLNKNDGRIKRLPAEQYRKGNGAFYRGCEHNADDRKTISINGLEIDFDLFCEFMGYYLSEGSLMRDSGVSIAQTEGEKARQNITECLEKIGLKVCLSNDKVSFYDCRINRYLKQFGTAYFKFVPAEILNASKRQIQIFLDAFVICDGYERKCKTFVGNRGNAFNTKNTERLYFTTSPRMAGNICELLLKVGHRPSFKVKQPATATKRNGDVISGNYRLYVINECHSTTASSFSKELIEYDDYVYDLTLERNHIMYVAVDGKCFWGSNCRCHAVPLLMSEEDFIKWNNGESVDKNLIKDVPENYKRWAAENADKIEQAGARGTQPYFVKDNKKYMQEAKRSAEITKDIDEKLNKATKPHEKNAFVSFEPFSTAIMEAVNSAKDRKQKNAIFDSIINDERATILNETNGYSTKLFPNNKGTNKPTWEDTKNMAYDMNKIGINVTFLPELKNGTSADALIQIGKTYRLVDFKYAITTNDNTLSKDLEKGFTQANTIVLKLVNMDSGQFRETIEYLKRNNIKYGNILLHNEYGKIIELSEKEIRSGFYKKKLKGFL